MAEQPAPQNRRFYIGMNDRVMCLDRASGEIVWDTVLDDAWPSPTLLLDAEHIYAGAGRVVACLDRTDGKVVWRQFDKSLSAPVGLALTRDIPGGQLFVSCSGLLFSYWAETGELLWRNGLKGYGYHPISLRVPGAIVAQPFTRRVKRGNSTVTQVLEDVQRGG